MWRVAASFAAGAWLLGCGSRTDISPVEISSSRSVVGDDASVDAGSGSTHLCNDGGLLEVSYLYDDSGFLYRYDPLSHAVTNLGSPSCGDSSPWTMTVGRENAYIEFDDGTIWAANLSTLACTQTPFDPTQLGLETNYALAISWSTGIEQLFVYGFLGNGTSPVLAVADTTSFDLTVVGTVSPGPPTAAYSPNLTAGASGRIYAYSPDGYVQELDPTTATVVSSRSTGWASDGTWASLTHGSDIYLFANSTVAGFDVTTFARTSETMTNVSPIGGGTVVLCNAP